MGSGAAPGVFAPRVDPLVVLRTGRVVVPHDRGVGDLPVREPHPRIRLHTEEEVEPERSRRRSTVAFRLRVRRRKAVGADVGVPGSERELPLRTHPLVGAQGRSRLPVVVRGDDDHLIGVARFHELFGHRRFGGRHGWRGRARHPFGCRWCGDVAPVAPGRRMVSPCRRPPRSTGAPPLRWSVAPRPRSSCGVETLVGVDVETSAGAAKTAVVDDVPPPRPASHANVATAASTTSAASAATATRRRCCLLDVRLRLVGSMGYRYGTSIFAATARRGSTAHLTRLAAAGGGRDGRRRCVLRLLDVGNHRGTPGFEHHDHADHDTRGPRPRPPPSPRRRPRPPRSSAPSLPSRPRPSGPHTTTDAPSAPISSASCS